MDANEAIKVLESMRENGLELVDQTDPDCPVGIEVTALTTAIQALDENRWRDELPQRVVDMCKHRGWSMDWTHRGAYLHLEASELIEAVRGKRGVVVDEAGDVLLVLMSITQYHGIPFSRVFLSADMKCKELMTKPRYPGEEHDGGPIRLPE